LLILLILLKIQDSLYSVGSSTMLVLAGFTQGFQQ
jgi:hypothetical protein